MTTDDVRAYFKSVYRFHKQTGMMMCTFYVWRKKGYIPFRSQKRLEAFTNGDLVAFRDGYTKKEESKNELF